MPAEALYIADAAVARLLGHGIDWLRANRSDLEQQYGFPKVDPAVGKTHREAVEVWARKRNVRDLARSSERLSETNQENINAF